MYRYLALGDSYTIGEAVSLHQSFPYQAIQLLRDKDIPFSAPEIVAQTGWTTEELLHHLQSIRLSDSYDFVSLLIGVNDQYRGLESEIYRSHFEQLLLKSIEWAGRNPSRVFVLSIPDWGHTPFAATKNPPRITLEIDLFNAINRQITSAHKANYIDITPSTRRALHQPELVAKDGLHPSEREYRVWAELLHQEILSHL
jgi:lysophospholipase L1-like esterase